MNLYLVVLGGRMRGGHVEIHDVRWVIGKTIESTFPKLKAEWIGNPSGLHLDSYKLIQFVDGFKIKLVSNAEVNVNIENKLWFINLGGYKTNEMLEDHHLELVVAKSAKEAKNKARKKWSAAINKIHTDDLAAIIHLEEYSLILEPDSEKRSDGMNPDWNGYWVIK